MEDNITMGTKIARGCGPADGEEEEEEEEENRGRGVGR